MNAISPIKAVGLNERSSICQHGMSTEYSIQITDVSGKEQPASPIRRPLQLNRNTKSDVTQKAGTKVKQNMMLTFQEITLS